MRRLVGISVALAIALGIVAGNLWLELREARSEIAGLRAHVAQPDPPALPLQASLAPAPAAIREIPEAVVAPASTAVTTAAEPVTPPPAPQVQQPVVRQAPVITEAVRTNALLQADQTATARVLAWKDRLAIAGYTLTTEQLQALNKVATAELRRETEESLELATTNQPVDVESLLRLREETLNRNHDTNMRILAAMSSHLTAEQSKALRTQFETGHATRLAGLRSDADQMRQQR
ncbi:MAG TPA: hypothetical protein VNQ32_02085 [Steroidobacteraceae bacterium]|nr:hypothetical protein [Steroidobacteraceae bacterium]